MHRSSWRCRGISPGALDALAAGRDSKTVPIAGGTNLIVDLRAKRERPDRVVTLGKVGELRGMDFGAETHLHRRPYHRHRSAALARGRGGGALAHRIRAPVRRADGAQHRHRGRQHRLRLPGRGPGAAAALPRRRRHAGQRPPGRGRYRSTNTSLGYKRDVRRPDELITRISWPRLPVPSVNNLLQARPPQGDAITVTGVALTLCAAGGTCTKARIALGAVAPVVLRARKAEALLEGRALTPALIDRAAAAAAAASSPIDDVRASAGYRLHTVEALTRRLVSRAWDRLDRQGDQGTPVSANVPAREVTAQRRAGSDGRSA